MDRKRQRRSITSFSIPKTRKRVAIYNELHTIDCNRGRGGFNLVEDNVIQSNECRGASTFSPVDGRASRAAWNLGADRFRLVNKVFPEEGP